MKFVKKITKNILRNISWECSRKKSVGILEVISRKISREIPGIIAEKNSDRVFGEIHKEFLTDFLKKFSKVKNSWVNSKNSW